METTSARILVVEDEAAIRTGLCDYLELRGFEPMGVASGEDGLAEGLSGSFDLVLLDLMLPGLSGFDVCEALRARHPRLPILMLTARGAEEDVLRGFRCGSDDYVTKPFSLAELQARIDSLLRRANQDPGASLPFEVAGLAVDPDRLRASIAGGGSKQVDLTRREVDLLALFAREPGRILSRERLLREVWGIERADRIETRTVDMHIAKLRKKLGPARDRIETVRGEGYRLSD